MRSSHVRNLFFDKFKDKLFKLLNFPPNPLKVLKISASKSDSLKSKLRHSKFSNCPIASTKHSAHPELI